MVDGVTQFLSQFTRIWSGGYFEGNPLDPMTPSTYGIYGYNSILYTTFCSCIRPYLAQGATVLEIGPGRGAWTKTFLGRGCERIYAVDVAPPEHTGFWEYVGYHSEIQYIVDQDLSLSEIPENSIDFFFSFGVFCHLLPEMCETYIDSLSRKMRSGGRGFLMIADFDKYNYCRLNSGKTSIRTIFDAPGIHLARARKQKSLILIRLVFTLYWYIFRKFLDLEPVDKTKVKNLVGNDGKGGWYHWGLERACAAIERAGFDIIESDVNVNPRDPIIHFWKPLENSG
jgi:hypothetical protein